MIGVYNSTGSGIVSDDTAPRNDRCFTVEKIVGSMEAVPGTEANPFTDWYWAETDASDNPTGNIYKITCVNGSLVYTKVN